MSRMLAFVRPPGQDHGHALSSELLERFADLARLHSDGWGAASRRDGELSTGVVAGRPATSEDLARAIPAAADAGLLYVRFGSANAGSGPSEAQPFRRGDRVFQHNGALSPASTLRAALTADERAELRGSNDSELYFTRVLRSLDGGIANSAPPSRREACHVDDRAVADAVADVRTLYPDACLNALLLTPSALVVVHRSAGRPAPFAAFAARGFLHADLPPGHDDEYNRLFTRRTPSGARLVATTGIPLAGWTALPDDTVSIVTPERVVSTPLPAAPPR